MKDLTEKKVERWEKIIPQAGHCRRCELDGPMCQCGCGLCFKARKDSREMKTRTTFTNLDRNLAAETDGES